MDPQLHCASNLSVLRAKNFSLTSNLNLSSFSLELLPLILSLSAHAKRHSPFFLLAPFKYQKATMRLCFDEYKVHAMSNIMREFSALLKAEVFISIH